MGLFKKIFKAVKKGVFQLIRSEVADVTAGVNQQKGIVSGVLDQITSFVPKVQSSWIGGDADEFAADVARKLIPALMDLIGAISGMSINISKAMNIVDQADRQCRSYVSGLTDRFMRI